MQISFRKDPVDVADLCNALKMHGAVYWHTSRLNFQRVFDLIEASGLEVISSCARAEGDFMNFMIRIDLVEDIGDVEARVAEAIIRWQALREPVPHVEDL